MIDVVIPKWGLTMDDASIGAWLVAVGDTVAEGDPLVELETDKITNELESPASGVIAEIVAAQGETVDVGVVIARIRPA